MRLWPPEEFDMGKRKQRTQIFTDSYMHGGRAMPMPHTVPDLQYLQYDVPPVAIRLYWEWVAREVREGLLVLIRC